jgi:predicted ATPase
MKLRIKNFRSLADTKDIDIKPITILIGKNSSGKSSFLRTFPMLKQSTEERTKSPILLYGNYVDFGSYKDIKPHFATGENDQYELGFSFDEHFFEFLTRRYRPSRHTEAFNQGKYFHISYNLKFEENDRELIRIHEIKCLIRDNEIVIKIDRKKLSASSITVNKKLYFKSEDNIRYFDRGGFFLELLKERKPSEFSNEFERLDRTIGRRVIALLSKYYTRTTSDDTKWKVLRMINFNQTDEKIVAKLKSIRTPKTWHERVANWTTEHEDFKTLKDLITLFDLSTSIGPAIDQYLTSTFSSIKYIAPLRATAERYYRIQHLAVDEVDPNGKNLPIFLDSLTETQMSAFQNWTFEHFSFKTKISKIEGHYSIKIVQEDLYEINLSDMGFGYSQILPIITQLWYTASRYESKRPVLNINRSKRNIIVIEQPELHLHPEFQAQFADAIAKVIRLTKEEKTNLSLIIETHSDIIINRLGDCIIANEISEEDVNIVVFNKASEKKPTDVSIAKFDENGNLINWPLGFFLPTSK